MKRTLLLAALFLLLGAGAYYAIIVKKNQNASHVSWDMDFAVEKPGEITKIFIADRKGKSVTLLRKEGFWEYNGRYKARPTAVQSLLETIQKVVVFYIPTDAAKPAIVRSLATDGIKVEIYGKDDKMLKTYYVGGVTQDERGTYMIMDGAEQPYVVHIPTFVGQLRVRYLVEEDDWRDRSVFSEDPEKIQSVSVEYPQQKSASFRLEKNESSEYLVSPYFSTTPAMRTPQRKGVPEAYLLKFESLGAEGFETNHPQRDSISHLIPFAIVTVKNAGGKEKQVRFWPQQIEYRRDNNQAYVTRYFAENDEKDFFLVQDQVFAPIFRSYGYFFSK